MDYFVGILWCSCKELQCVAECPGHPGQEEGVGAEAPGRREAREVGPSAAGDQGGEWSTAVGKVGGVFQHWVLPLGSHGYVFDGVVLQWESKVEEGRKNFEAASETLRQEVKRFEVWLLVVASLHRLQMTVLYAVGGSSGGVQEQVYYLHGSHDAHATGGWYLVSFLAQC